MKRPTLHQEEKLAEAKEACLQTLHKNPGHVRAHYNLASALVGLGEHDRALALLAELGIGLFLGDAPSTGLSESE